jgi:DNA-binding SARP family transcriptional activator
VWCAHAHPTHDLTAAVFEDFPHGIMVCEPDGRIVGVNERARDLAGPGAAAADTCCTVLGCGRPGTPLDGGCVSAMALEAAACLPELSLELPGGRVGVTAAPLGPQRSRVVIALRRAGPRRPETPQLRIFALGRLRVETADRPLSGDWLDQRPGQVLRCLVCERHRAVPTEVLAETIWRQAGPTAPNTVRYIVHTLRDRLEPGRPRHGGSSFVVSKRGGYALDAERVWIDADEFEAAAGDGLRALASGDEATARRRLELAVALYKGDLLADDPYAEWALRERERLRALMANALRALSHLTRDEPELALGHLERLAQLDPFDNDAARDLICAWLRVGRRSRAVRFYRAFELRLLREFGEHPDFGLHDVVQASAEPVRLVG